MAHVKKGSIRERPAGSGRWEITIDTGRVNPDGGRIRVYEKVVGSRAEAERKKRDLLNALDDGILSTDKITLASWLAKWMKAEIAPQRRIQTQERYQRAIDKHITPAIGNVLIAKLKPLDIQGLQESLRSTLKPSTILGVRSVLSCALKWAESLEVISRNPVSRVKAPSIKQVEVTIPDMEVVGRILIMAQEDEHRLTAAMHLAAYTGMRRGEIMGLKWQDVSLIGKKLEVVGSLVKTKAGLILEPPKTAKGRRMVRLDDTTIRALEAHREAQDAVRVFMGKAYVDKGRVFSDAYGDWVQPEALLRALQHYGAKVGYPGMTCHKLRHVHVSALLRGGLPIHEVANRVGHANTNITQRYAHTMPGAQEEAADLFANMMQSASVGNLSANRPDRAYLR